MHVYVGQFGSYGDLIALFWDSHLESQRITFHAQSIKIYVYISQFGSYGVLIGIFQNLIWNFKTQVFMPTISKHAFRSVNLGQVFISVDAQPVLANSRKTGFPYLHIDIKFNIFKRGLFSGMIVFWEHYFVVSVNSREGVRILVTTRSEFVGFRVPKSHDVEIIPKSDPPKLYSPFWPSYRYTILGLAS